MESITFEEFSKMPKKEVNKTRLKHGRNYYIQETRGSTKTVYKGTFIGTNERGDYNNFENVEFVVNPHRHLGKPFGFNNRSGFKFLEIMEPTSRERSIKNKTINELNEFINEQRIEPKDITPNISFIGEDYRTARDKRFNDTKTKRSSSSSNSKARGIKRRKTAKRRKSSNKKK
jgi:hypothetical protein